MPEIPDAALRAAADAVERELMSPTRYDTHMDSDEALARTVLDAAAPILAEAVAQKILAHMEIHASGPAGTATHFLARRRAFQTAARVAAGAFTTEAESKRMAAEALAAGNYVACDIPEDGEP